MANRKPPLSGRDLIRYLPDLLTGKEPVFDDPAVQRFITQDPEGRAAVGLIADTAAALTVAHDRIATQTYTAIKPLRDSVLAAKKYAKRQLADLLFYEGMRRWQSALHSLGQFCSYDYAAPDDAPTIDCFNIDALTRNAVEELISLPRALRAGLQELTLIPEQRSPNAAIKFTSSLFAGDVALVPDRNGSQFMLTKTISMYHRRMTPMMWLTEAAKYSAPSPRACAIDNAVILHLERGEYGAARRLVDELHQLAPNEPIIQIHLFTSQESIGLRTNFGQS
ncbi:MAG: hypothetical protein IPH13_18380 [Planctomycetes bacterium]|nr:hypothetical protein [Planctomycetota bacterium]